MRKDDTSADGDGAAGSQREESELGEDFVGGIWAGLKISVPGVALGWMWKEGTAPGLVYAHAWELVVAGAVLLVVHLLSDARLLRRAARRLQRRFAKASGPPAALPDGWTAGNLDDGTPFWFHRDTPDEIRFEAPRPPSVDGQSRLERPSSSAARPVVVLADYGISKTRGCLLPERQVADGEQRTLLPPAFSVLESMARDLPRLLAEGTGAWRAVLSSLEWAPAHQAAAVSAVIQEGQGAVQRARMVVLFLVQAWRFAPCSPSSTPPVPPWIADLWDALHGVNTGSSNSVTPLVLDYSNYVLHNCETMRAKSGRRAYGPVLMFTGGDAERGLLACLLAIESAGGQALLDSVRVQEAARDWDSEGVAESLQAVRATLSELCLTISVHMEEAVATTPPNEHADSARLLSRILRSPQHQGCCSALQPSGIFAAVGALLGIDAPPQAPTAMSTTVSAIPGGTNVPGYIAAVAAGPSVAGFAQHCWDALEGASSGDCPFVGAREYAVLEAFDKCASSLHEFYERLLELHARCLSGFVDPDDGTRTKSPQTATSMPLVPPLRTPFLRSVPSGPAKAAESGRPVSKS